jgi:radical SAM-linked protein
MARFLSHHDLMRFFERGIRRAGLPVKMSQGYNPRPRFSIAAALGVGVAAEHEILDIEFDEQINPEVVRKRLSETMIPGIEITDARYARGKSARVTGARYHIRLPEDTSVSEHNAKRLLDREDIVVERKSKKKNKRIDIRPYILSIEILDSGSAVSLRLQVTDRGTARPEEVVAELLGEPEMDRNQLEITRKDLELEPEKKS